VKRVWLLVTSRSTALQTYFSFSLRSRAPGSIWASHSTWKPLQMPTVATPRSAAALTSVITGDSAAMAAQRR
jgi:hypothetical protein